MKFWKMAEKNNLINRYTAVLLSLLIVLSVFSGMVFAEEKTLTATDSHVVYSDDFSNAETLEKWRWSAVDNPSYSNLTSSISDGKMTFNNTNASGSFLHGLRFIPDAKYTEQRAEVVFKAKKGLKPCLWTRVNQTYKGNSQSVYGYYLMFNCNHNGNLTLDLAKRMGTTGSSIGNIGYGTPIVEGQEYRMEMVVQGTNPTLISVSLYTNVGSVKDAVVCHNTFIDSEASLQLPGSAGISGARTSMVSETDVSVESFEFTSTDKVTGKYYVEEGTTGSKTFGQLVMLDPTKRYVLSAHAKDNGLRSGEDVNPLWIEYFNNNSSYTRVLTGRGSLKSNRTSESAESAGVDYNEYFTVFYDEFDLSKCSDKKIESGIGNKTRVIVGFRCDASTTTAGMFSHFSLYAADDPKKTNLLINPDFKMGLYGWYDEAGSYMNYTQMRESTGTTAKGYASLKSISDEEYKELFKNKDFLTPVEPPKDYMLKNTGVLANEKFGQIVELDSKQEYTYTVNYKNINQKGSKPAIWYKDLNGEYKLFENYNLVYEDLTESRITYNFKPYADDIGNDSGKVTLLVGYDSGDMGAEVYYRNFELYLSNDVNKTNIIKNPDFKSGLKHWTASCQESFEPIEDEAILSTQDGCAQLVEFTDENYFDRTELPEGKIVIHNNGEKDYGKIGNIVYLDPSKTYVYGVSYKYIDQKSCKPFIQYNNGSAILANFDPDSVSLNKEADEEYFRNYYEFKLPEDAKREADSTVKVKIGYTTGNLGADAYFGDFVLYEKNDKTKTNLLTNADFKEGFKGWSEDSNPVTTDNKYNLTGADLIAVSDDFFKRPTVEKLEGNWVIHNTGMVEYAKFGQIVELDPAKTYIYSVSYKYIDQKGSMPYMRYYNGAEYKNFDSYISEVQDEEYYRALYEFKAPAEAEVQANGKVKMQIGITCGMSSADAYFGDFLLYEKDDKSKTNLFVNADFALGLYGWTSNGYNNLPVSDYGVMKTLQGDVELVKVEDDYFKRPATEKLEGNWVIHNTGKVEYAKFGQIVELDPAKIYIYSVSYKYKDQKGSMPYMRYFDGKNYQNFSAYISEKQDDIYYRAYYEFKAPAEAVVQANGKVKMQIGITCGMSGANSYFGDFLLYEKKDKEKTNLFINADFALGLYGWTSNGYNNLPVSDYGVLTTKQGDVELVKVEDEYFKRPATEKLEGNWVIHNTGVVEYAKFGQIVELDPAKTYVYSVSYKYIDQKGSMPYIRYFDGNTYQNFNAYISETQDDEYYRASYIFKAPAEALVQSNGKVKMQIGITCGMGGANSYFGDFLLYDKSDKSKNNIFINADFALGLYGWTSNGYNSLPISDYGVLTTKQGDVELVKVKDNYFKRPKFERLQGNWVVHNTGKVEYAKFGQIVELDPAKTYIYSVSYKYKDQKGSMPYMRYFDGKTYQNYTEFISETQDEGYYRAYYEFKVPAQAAVQANGKVKMQIGITCGMKGADAYFGDFLLYDKQDKSKENLFINADFALGFYGWTSNGYNNLPISDYGVTKTLQGDVELVKVEDNYFKRPKFERLQGNWVVHNTGTVEYAKFGQIVELDPAKTYIYSVSYKYKDQKGSMPYMRYFDGKTYQNYTEFISETQDEGYYRAYYEFKVPAQAAVQANGKVKMQIGITCGMKGADAYFGDFLLYDKQDKSKENLFINADFALGFYGWTSNGYNNLPISDYGVTKTLQGDVELVKVEDNYFKRPKFERLQGNWVVHNTGKVEYAKFGQIVELDPAKTYIYAVSYKYEKQNGSMPFMLYFDGSSYVNYTDFVSVEQDNEYYREYYEFKIPPEAAVQSNGKVKMKVGITCGMKEADAYFGDFLLHDKSDKSKENLIMNYDFELGLYGWTSNGYNNLPISDYGVKETIQGDVELVKVEDDYFKRPAFDRFEEEPMFHITGKWNYAHPGQIVELNPGETYYYSMYEKYFAQNGSKPLVFIKKDGSYTALAKELEIKSQDLKQCFTIYQFTVPKDVDVKSNGKSEVLVGFTTGITGADAYFYDLQVYSSKDKSKTNLFVNPDFELGLYGWTGTSYNYKPETEFGAKVFRYKQEAELLPYDASIFVNDLSDEFFDDGDWASKFGNDYTMSEWLAKIGAKSDKDAPVENNVNQRSQNIYWIIIPIIGGMVLIGGIFATVVVFIKKKKKR